MGRRLRKLQIGDHTFAWTAEIGHLQGQRDCHRCIRLRVWGDGKNSRPLQVDLLSTTWSAPYGCATDSAYPTPADVKTVIVQALRSGWQPAVKGGVFLLTEQEHAESFELPNFLIIDRRQKQDTPDPTALVINAYSRRNETQMRAGTSTATDGVLDAP
jgi:hypothetical protein